MFNAPTSTAPAALSLATAAASRMPDLSAMDLRARGGHDAGNIE